jgi:HK97 family phage major capsid protein
MSTAQSGTDFVRSFGEVSRSIAGLPPLDGVARAWNTYGGGPNGGFLLDAELIASVWDKARAVDGPLSRCLFLPTTKHKAAWPAFDESSRANGSRFGGMRAKWRGTTDDASLSASASQPAIATVDFVPKRFPVFSAPFSRDLLQDAPIVERMLEYAAVQEIRYAVVDAMINGLGVTHPLGVVNAKSTIAVPRATPGAISQADVDNAWSRMWGFCRRNAVWICNDDTLLKVDQAATTLGWPAATYLPQGVAGNPYPLLKGRPLLPVEQCPVLGATGDLILGDWSQYAVVARTVDHDGRPDMELSFGSLETFVEQQSSDQFLFDTDSIVWRFKIRIDGRPLWKQPVTIADGSQTAAPFVVVA